MIPRKYITKVEVAKRRTSILNEDFMCPEPPKDYAPPLEPSRPPVRSYDDRLMYAREWIQRKVNESYNRWKQKYKAFRIR